MSVLRRRRFLAMAGGALAAACVPTVTPPASATPAALTLEEKVGQLMTVAFHGTKVTSHLETMIRAKQVGGVILFSENAPDADAVRRLSGELQAIAREAGARPLFIAMDHEGGAVIRVGRGLTVLPGAMALAATPDPVASVERASRIAAAELRAAGVTWDLAPVSDVLDEPQNAILLSRSFGSDPARVGELAAAWVRGHDAMGVLSCAKHFPGHGSTTVDPHTGLPELDHDRARLDRVELVPFRAAIAARVPAVMSAHILLTAIDREQPATLSPRVIDGILRKDLSFDGVIVSDDLEMGALRSYGGIADVAVRAVAAGVDHVLFRYDEAAQRAGHRQLVDAFTSGRIPPARLDASVERIRGAKARYASVAATAVDPSANAAAATDLARQAVTVLRSGGVLPLRGRILAVAVDRPDITLLLDTLTIGDALRERGAAVTALASSQRPGASDIQSAVAAAKSADVVVVTTADLQANPQQAQLVRALAEAKPTVMASLRSPYDALAVPQIPAYVLAYYGRSSAVNALADVLLGKVRPQGRLPVEIPGLWKIGAGLQDLR